jgi:hypothetical protein
MSSIAFANIVNQVLKEVLSNDLKPQTGDSNLDSIGAVVKFVGQLVFREGGYARQDTLITFKPIWPYADTFDFIRTVFVQAGILQNNRESVKKLGDAIQKSQNSQELINNLITTNALDPATTATLIKSIDDRVNFLNSNKNNYRNYFNTTLKQLNDETGIIAAEPYLNSTPQESIVRVLQDFGGYDMKTAEKIVMYPGENKYTQMGPNIGGVVMASIIEISKLMLVFYREFVQDHANEVLALLNVQNQKPQVVSQAILAAGRESSPTDPISNAIKNDYIAFLNGMSSLVLSDYSFLTPKDEPRPDQGEINKRVRAAVGRSAAATQSSNYRGFGDSLNLFDKFYKKVFVNEAGPGPLIRTISDFRSLPGTGQQVFQAYVHLFNNMREGEVPSKWQTGSKAGMDILGGTLSNLASTFSKFRGL